MKTQPLISDKYVVPLPYKKEKSLLDQMLRWKNYCWFTIVGVMFCRAFIENKFALIPYEER